MANYQAFYDVLKSWYGRKEPYGDDYIIDVYNNQRPSGSYKMTHSDPWCHATQSAAAYKSGNQNVIPNTCYCPTGVNWFKNKGRWVGRYYKNYNPQPGNIIYYDWGGDGVSDHVGCIIRRNGDILTVREGNYHDALLDRQISVYSTCIMGYGIPLWTATNNTTVPVAERNWLQKGDSGEKVKDLQTKLIACGYDCGTYGADGDYGSATVAAVKKFQSAMGITVDGAAGEITLAKLNSAYATLGYASWVGAANKNCSVYAKADKSGATLSTYPKLNKGNLFDVVGTAKDSAGNKYFKIVIAAKFTGYILQSDTTTPNPADKVFRSFNAECTGDGVRVRRNAGTQYDTIDEYPSLNKTNRVKVIGKKNDNNGVLWYNVLIQDKFKGYVRNDYIKKI